MELILLFLTATLMGALFIGFFCLGYWVRSKKPDDGLELNKSNKDFIREMVEWKNYGGK